MNCGPPPPATGYGVTPPAVVTLSTLLLVESVTHSVPSLATVIALGASPVSPVVNGVAPAGFDDENFTSAPDCPTHTLPSWSVVIALDPAVTPVTSTPVAPAGFPGGIFTSAFWPASGDWLIQMNPPAEVIPPPGVPSSLFRSALAYSFVVPSGCTLATALASTTQTLPSGPTVSWPFVATPGRSNTPSTCGAASAEPAGASSSDAAAVMSAVRSIRIAAA